MAETFFESIREILSIQRWNFVPRFDEWSEAENIAYYTHLAYALAKCMDISRSEISVILCRCLLKSYNKHYLSDVPISSRDAIKNINENAWKEIIDDAAKKTSKFFPRELREFAKTYMQYNFAGETTLNEEIIKYSQYMSAFEEYKNNANVFPIKKYDEIGKEIKIKIDKLNYLSKFDEIYNNIASYTESVRLLKYVRRWNRLNRNIQSSVMAHTFVVSVLAMYFSILEKGHNVDFIYECVVRSLFHDVPESITGDIITPVKDIINKNDDKLWEKVEESMINEFIIKMPKTIKEETEKMKLLRLSSNAPLGTPEALVKECDKFALVLECAFENRSGNRQTEIIRAYSKYVDELRNSEWPRIREYAGRIVDEYPTYPNS
jgi:putative hydrolases of HD superfamily